MTTSLNISHVPALKASENLRAGVNSVPFHEIASLTPLDLFVILKKVCISIKSFSQAKLPTLLRDIWQAQQKLPKDFCIRPNVVDFGVSQSKNRCVAIWVFYSADVVKCMHERKLNKGRWETNFKEVGDDAWGKQLFCMCSTHQSSGFIWGCERKRGISC